jgi:periplasmic mercuric ion binding protein
MIMRLVTASALVVGLATPAVAADQTVTLKVDNMYCDLCPITVKKSLANVSGVKGADVSFERKTATVTFDDTKTNVAALVEATTNAGYPSKLAP